MMKLEDPSWWTANSPDAETWAGPHNDRESAIEHAREVEDRYICSARRALFSLSDLVPDDVDYDFLVDRWCDDNEEFVGPDGEHPFEYLTSELQKEFLTELRRAADAWAASKEFGPRPAFMFGTMDTPEEITLEKT